jgi:hypothetical protein
MQPAQRNVHALLRARGIELVPVDAPTYFTDPELGEPREGKQTMLDRLGVLALVLFNFAVLVSFGWIILRVLRSL